MATTNITSLASMRDYIKRMLGAPILNVELDNDQLDHIIVDSSKIFTRYMYGEGTYEDYIIFTVSAGVDTYSLSADHSDVEDIIDIDLSSASSTGINVLHSNSNLLLHNDWVIGGNYPGGPGNSFSTPGMTLASYEIAMNYLDQINERFARDYRTDFRQATKTLHIIPTPKEDGVGMLSVYKRESAENLYNHILFRRLCVAKSKYLWGSILSKHTMILPGGGTINGQEIKADGKGELEDVMQEIKTEGEHIGFFIG